MIRRMWQRGCALGLIGIFGVMFIAGPASGLPARQDPESIEPAAAAEGLGEKGLTLEEQDEMRAWVASMEAAPLETRVEPKPECEIAPYNCPHPVKCNFPDGSANCNVTQCGDGKCGLCPNSISQLIYKGWCAYGCTRVRGGIVGGAFILKTPFAGNKGSSDPYCIDKDGKIYDKEGKPIW